MVNEMKELTRTIGVKLKVRTYCNGNIEEEERVIFSVRELYNLLSMVRFNNIVYGVGVEVDSIVLHLFVDRTLGFREPIDTKLKDLG